MLFLFFIYKCNINVIFHSCVLLFWRELAHHLISSSSAWRGDAGRNSPVPPEQETCLEEEEEERRRKMEEEEERRRKMEEEEEKRLSKHFRHIGFLLWGLLVPIKGNNKAVTSCRSGWVTVLWPPQEQERHHHHHHHHLFARSPITSPSLTTVIVTCRVSWSSLSQLIEMLTLIQEIEGN